MKDVTQLFLQYVSYETTSREDSDTFPSTLNQLDLLRLLRDQLAELGLETDMDEYGYVYNYRIVDASYETVDLATVSENYALWQTIASDGIVREQTDTTLVHMYWRVSD